MAQGADVHDPGKTSAGKGGKFGRRGEGGHGTQGDQGGHDDPTQGDLITLAQMLKRIQQSIGLLVPVRPPAVPEALHSEFTQNWPIVNLALLRGIVYLMSPPRPSLLRKLREAGLTGSMLKFKQVSLYYHLDRLDEAVRNYNARPIITAPLSKEPDLMERIFKCFKPGCKTINSVLGSMPKIIPGVEIAKEFKEHLEAAYDIVETAQEDRGL